MFFKSPIFSVCRTISISSMHSLKTTLQCRISFDVEKENPKICCFIDVFCVWPYLKITEHPPAGLATTWSLWHLVHAPIWHLCSFSFGFTSVIFTGVCCVLLDLLLCFLWCFFFTAGHLWYIMSLKKSISTPVTLTLMGIWGLETVSIWLSPLHLHLCCVTSGEHHNIVCFQDWSEPPWAHVPIPFHAGHHHQFGFVSVYNANCDECILVWCQAG